MESIANVCRLCMKSDQLVWIFDSRCNVEDVKNVVFITTGVEICDNDDVSQKVCGTCIQVSAKMYDFRRNAQRCDKILKARYREILKNGTGKHGVGVDENKPVKAVAALDQSETPPTFATAEESSITVKLETGSSNNEIAVFDKPHTNQAKSEFKIHPSIQEVLTTYPLIRIPKRSLKWNISPYVSMPMEEVENYFKERNLDFFKHAEQVLRLARKEPLSDAKIHKQLKSDDNSKQDVVMPITITSNKTGYTIVSKNQAASENVSDKSKNVPAANENVANCSAKQTNKISKKRKYPGSDGDTTVNGSKRSSTGNASLAWQVDKSVPLFICNLCNSVLYSSKSLSRHRMTHLVCPFCKLRLKSFEAKSEHIDKHCVVKKSMSQLPNVYLEKIEFDVDVRRKYPAAFTGFDPLPSEQCKEIDKDIKSELILSHTSRDNTSAGNVSTGVIEIVDDEDDPRSSTARENLKEAPTLKGNDVDHNSSSTQGSLESSVTPATPQEPITSVSIIRPDIKIKNSNILDYIDPKANDVKLIKDLLTVRGNIKAGTEQSTQTDLMVNSSIVVNPEDVTAEFKKLKPLLQIYKVPVIIKDGQFNVTYTQEQVESKQKNMFLWNHIPPVDVIVNRSNGAQHNPSRNTPVAHVNVNTVIQSQQTNATQPLAAPTSQYAPIAPKNCNNSTTTRYPPVIQSTIQLPTVKSLVDTTIQRMLQPSTGLQPVSSFQPMVDTANKRPIQQSVPTTTAPTNIPVQMNIPNVTIVTAAPSAVQHSIPVQLNVSNTTADTNAATVPSTIQRTVPTSMQQTVPVFVHPQSTASCLQPQLAQPCYGVVSNPRTVPSTTSILFQPTVQPSPRNFFQMTRPLFNVPQHRKMNVQPPSQPSPVPQLLSDQWPTNDLRANGNQTDSTRPPAETGNVSRIPPPPLGAIRVKSLIDLT